MIRCAAALLLPLVVACEPAVKAAVTVPTTAMFEDITAAASLGSTGRDYGVAVGDYDADGFDDIYVSTTEGPNRLYRNNGDGTFEDVTATARVAGANNTRTGVWGDFDNDGYLDLYLGVFDEEDILYRNQGDGTFADVSAAAGIENVGRPYSVSLADVDRDGFLDVYVANFRQENAFYRNRGDGTFEDVILASTATSSWNAMGTVFFDYDNDSDLDLFLSHDGQPNMLYENVGDFSFVDVSRASGLDYRGFGMGVDVADVDRDGDLDVYVTYLDENQLFLNDGNKTFTNVSEQAGAGDYGMGWGTNFFDYDNDGLVDVHVANDSHFSAFPNAVYRNVGASAFEQVVEDEPITSMRVSYGSATSDFDGDGRLDVVVANLLVDEESQLFANGSAPVGHWIAFDLEGVQSNRSAIGARIECVDDRGVLHVDEVNAGSGFAASSSLTVHFGLGAATSVTKTTIRWPNGLVQALPELAVGRRYAVRERPL